MAGILLTAGVGLIFISIIALAFYLALNSSKSKEIDLKHLGLEESVRKSIKPSIERWNPIINKDLLIGYRNKKGTIVKEDRYDLPIESIKQLDSTEESEEFEIDKEKLVEDVKNSKMSDDLKQLTLKRIKDGKVPNRVLIVKRSRFSRKKDIIMISETDVLHENKNELVLRSDTELRPYESRDKPKVWYADNLTSYGSLASTNYQILAQKGLEETRRKIEIVKDLELKHIKELDKIETKAELMEEMKKGSSASNFDYS